MSFMGIIEIYVTAAELGSFTKAGQIHHISRSAVGKSIAKLESHLDVKLFNRSNKTIQLTDEGVLFLEGCKKALENISSVEHNIRNRFKMVSGRLKISVPASLGQECITPILLRILKEYEDLEYELTYSDRVVDIINEGYDLVIRNGIDSGNSVSLSSEKLATHHLVYCASPEYLKKMSPITDPSDIERNHYGLVYGNETYQLKWFYLDAKNQLTELSAYKSKIISNDLGSIAKAAVQGMGVTWLPTWLIDDELKSGELVEVFKPEKSKVINTYAIWPKSDHVPYKTKIIIDALKDNLPKIVLP